MLRPYQEETVTGIREKLLLKHDRSVLAQAPTGTGKTAIFSEILSRLSSNNKRAWVIVPRKELVNQSSESLTKWKTPHGIIAPGYYESGAYNIHVVSKDTLIRRYEKIKYFPDFIFFDEGHLFLDRQIEIAGRYNQAQIIGFTATPERLDGRGLSTASGGIYDSMIESYSIPWFTEHDYLVPLWYCKPPPIRGIEKLHKRGIDVDANEFENLLESYDIYGDVIEQYRKHGHNRPALVFCRNVKSAYTTAEKFRQAGYNFYCIEGNMSHKERRTLLKALELGKIHGLTNCEIATYGLDIPRVEVGICLRPTFSRALYMQMIGRIIRPWECNEYQKTHAIFIDHVNNVLEHSETGYPGLPLHHIPHIEWNFNGVKKRKRSSIDEDEAAMKYCTVCNIYFDGLICPNCGAEKKKRAETKLDQINVDLEVVKPQKLNERPEEERREFIDKINHEIRDFKEGQTTGKILPGPVGKLLELAVQLDRSVMWVYWRLTAEDRETVNIPLLHEMARQKGYKKGWAWHQQKKVKEQMKRNKKEIEEAAEVAGLFG